MHNLLCSNYLLNWILFPLSNYSSCMIGSGIELALVECGIRGYHCNWALTFTSRVIGLGLGLYKALASQVILWL